MPHRCAFGCKSTDVVMHVFPKPDKFPERFKVWVDLVGGKPEDMSDLEFYKKKRVCDIHFADEVRVRCKRVSAIAIPSLHLPDRLVVAKSLNAKNIDTIQPVTENPKAPINQSDRLVVAKSLDAKNINTIQPVTENPTAPINQSDYIITISQAPMDIDENQPLNQTSSIKQSVVFQGFRTSTSVLREHNYCIISSQKTIPKDIQGLCEIKSIVETLKNLEKKSLIETHTKYLEEISSLTDAQKKTATCCCKNLKKKIKSLQSEVKFLRKKEQIFKQRLANARKLTNEVSFLQVAKCMTKPAQLLAHMQLQTKKKPKGRRFSIEEKVLCASLFKNSPENYRLLSNFFTLPSKKAMKRLLNEVKLIPELNSI